MKNNTPLKAYERRIARIFEDVGGFYVCDDAADFLDARGFAHTTKADALRAAARDYGDGENYTHATGSGTYWHNNIRRIPAKYRQGAC